MWRRITLPGTLEAQRYSDVLTSETESLALDPDISFIIQNIIQFFVLDGARIIDAICCEPVFRSKDQNLPNKLPLNRA